jgi:hypothetical protein
MRRPLPGDTGIRRQARICSKVLVQLRLRPSFLKTPGGPPRERTQATIKMRSEGNQGEAQGAGVTFGALTTSDDYRWGWRQKLTWKVGFRHAG